MPKASSSSASTSTSYPNLIPAIEAAANSQVAHRSHSKRSCTTCEQGKKRKTRCELPKFDVPASPFPLSEELACHRCKLLKIDCVVPDKLRGGNSKPKSKRLKSQEGEELQLEQADQSTNATDSPRSTSPTPLLPLFELETRFDRVSILAEGYPLGRKMKLAERLIILTYPLMLLSELLKKQPDFGRDLMISRDQDQLCSIQQVLNLIKDSIEEMEHKLRVIMLHLPHLPNLKNQISAFDSERSLSLRLLLSTTVLITLPSNVPNKSKIQAFLRKIIQQDIFTSVMSQNRDIRSIQALQLIAVYSPISLVSSSSGSVPFAGSLCLSMARSPAISMDFDHALEKLKHLQAASSFSTAQEQSRLDREAEAKDLAEQAIIWHNIKAWTAHFEVFEHNEGRIRDPESSQSTENELESSLLAAFTDSSNDSEETSARIAGCISTKHRLRLYRTFTLIRPELIRAGVEMPPGELRSAALFSIFERCLPLLDRCRRTRDDEFAELSSDEYTQNIISWLNLEADYHEAALFTKAMGSALKEALLVVEEGPSRFFQVSRECGGLQYGAKVRSLKRTSGGLPSISSLKSLSSSNSIHAFGSPPRSTSAWIVFAANQCMEQNAAGICLTRELLPTFEGELSIVEGLVEILKSMDPNSTLESGSIPQASAKIVEGIASTMRVWRWKLSQIEDRVLAQTQVTRNERQTQSDHSPSNGSLSSQFSSPPINQSHRFISQASNIPSALTSSLPHHPPPLPPTYTHQDIPDSFSSNSIFPSHEITQFNLDSSLLPPVNHQDYSFSNQDQHQHFHQHSDPSLTFSIDYPAVNVHYQQQQHPDPIISDAELDRLLRGDLLLFPSASGMGNVP